MAAIRLLDENISSRIAAGEVVERPASIVKELIENSIDAGASAISIAVYEGGIKSIRVSDNGMGIASEDMPLTLVKHATSKIYTLSDLEKVYTMGFRGEALSSIAAVSMLTIKSKTKQEDVGSVLSGMGGKDIRISAAGIPDGTTVQVERLFFNTPARLKFLKKPAAETAQISAVVASHIIAHPEISFKYSADDKLLYHSPGNKELLDAVMCVDGRDIRPHLLEVKYELYGMNLIGFAGSPDISFKRNCGRVFVNTRPIRSDIVSSAVQRAFGERLMKGATPYYVLNISLSPSDVDANVHPGKLTVHFKDDAAVSYLVLNGVSEALNNRVASPVIEIKKVGTTPEHVSSPCQNMAEMSYKEQNESDTENMIRDIIDKAMELRPQVSSMKQFVTLPSIEREPVREQRYIQPNLVTKIVDYKVVGTVFSGYIIVEAGDAVYFIDQHAAHERLIYDQLTEAVKKEKSVQRLLISDAVKLSHAEYQVIENSIPALEKLGFDIEPFGQLSYKISAIPVYVSGSNIGTLIRNIAEELIESPVLDENILPEKIALAACKRAVKASWELPKDVVDDLVKELTNSDAIPNCPHGRPVAVAFTKAQLEKSFKRRL